MKIIIIVMIIAIAIFVIYRIRLSFLNKEIQKNNIPVPIRTPSPDVWTTLGSNFIHDFSVFLDKWNIYNKVEDGKMIIIRKEDDPFFVVISEDEYEKFVK